MPILGQNNKINKYTINRVVVDKKAQSLMTMTIEKALKSGDDEIKKRKEKRNIMKHQEKKRPMANALDIENMNRVRQRLPIIDPYSSAGRSILCENAKSKSNRHMNFRKKVMTSFSLLGNFK